MSGREPDDLLQLTSTIVSAYAAHHSIAHSELDGLIRQVYGSLEGADKAAAEERKEPAVPVRRSVKRDFIVCLECGSQHKMLKRHLRREHGMTPAEYREWWELKSDYPMVAPSYAEKRSELAKRIGLGRKPAEKPQARGRRKTSTRTARSSRRSRSNEAAAH